MTLWHTLTHFDTLWPLWSSIGGKKNHSKVCTHSSYPHQAKDGRNWLWKTWSSAFWKQTTGKSFWCRTVLPAYSKGKTWTRYMMVNARAKDTVLAETKEDFSRTFLEAYPKSNRRYHTKNTCNTGRWRQDAEASVWHTDPFRLWCFKMPKLRIARQIVSASDVWRVLIGNEACKVPFAQLGVSPCFASLPLSLFASCFLLLGRW